MAPTGPVFHSLVLDEIAAPDYLDVIAVPLPPRAPVDPAIWASELFTIASTPVWVRVAFVVRQALVPAHRECPEAIVGPRSRYSRSSARRRSS